MPIDIHRVGVRGDRVSAADLAAVAAGVTHTGFAYLAIRDSRFDHAGAAAAFGKPLLQYAGEQVRDVRPDEAMRDAEISANNMKALSPHSEMFESPGLPPRYVVLWCVHEAEGTGGETTLVDFLPFIESFGAADQRAMRSRIYEWRSPASLAASGIELSARHPIIEDHQDAIVVRYSSREMYVVDPVDEDGLHERYVQGGVRHFAGNHVPIRIHQNDMLIWDNWRMVHSRNAFSDPRRHLRRMLLGQAGRVTGRGAGGA